MKRLKVITISLLLSLFAFGGISAYAEDSGTIYPKDEDFIKSLTFTSLDDYAVDGGKYTFLQNDRVYVYEDGELNGFDYDEDTYTFLPAQQEITSGSYLYYFDDDGALTVYNKSSKLSSTFEGEYSNLKEYGGTVYAVRENTLYSFNADGEHGVLEQEINLEYYDYFVTSNISIGQASEELKNYSDIKFVTVKAGSHMTEVDLTSLEGVYFSTGETISVNEDTVALLLCYSGNSAIVALGDVSYIVLKDNTEEKADVNCTAVKEFENATITGNRIYASPYVIIGTSAMQNAAGTIVKILNKYVYDDVLGSAFYEVEYTAEGTVKKGYVADGFLTEYIIEDNKQPSVIVDPAHSEKNDIQTVLLILAVVVLVLVAVGYLVYVGTSDKRKKNDKKQKDAKSDSQKTE